MSDHGFDAGTNDASTTRATATVNGGSLYYEARGSGDAVVLLHGFTLDRRVFDSQFAALSKSHHVVRFDMRGHGRSSGTRGADGGPLFFSQSEDLLGLLDFLKIDRAHIVGLSMGAYVGYEFALNHPERVLSLAAVDSAWWFDSDNTGDFQRRLVEYLTAAAITSLEVGLRAWISDALFAPAVKNPDLKPRLEEIVMGGHLALGPQAHFANPMSPSVPSPLAETRLGELKISTLVVVGEHEEPEFAAHADKIAKAVGGATKVVIPGSGHVSTMEKPDDVNRALTAFLAGD